MIPAAKVQKKIEIHKQRKKYVNKFAHIKKMLYLCSDFGKDPKKIGIINIINDIKYSIYYAYNI